MDFVSRTLTFAFSGLLLAGAHGTPEDRPAFTASSDGGFNFVTGTIAGRLRDGGRSNGLHPLRHAGTGGAISAGTGLFNHYRVFSRGKRYGYGARRWPSTATIRPDGGVEVVWPGAEDRPFTLRAVYRLEPPHTVHLETSVQAAGKLEDFEVLLASYFDAGFTESLVPLGGEDGLPRLVPADLARGEWQCFPRDSAAARLILDGRWALEPGPIAWRIMEPYARPFGVRRNPATGVTVILLGERDTCFAVSTPHAAEKHVSFYLSLFGRDLAAGETAVARSRLVFLDRPTDGEILRETTDIAGTSRSCQGDGEGNGT